jgi:hypothetical protein
MDSLKGFQYSDVCIEDIKAIDELKEISDQEAEEIRLEIVSLCDVMAAIIIEETKMKPYGK